MVWTTLWILGCGTEPAAAPEAPEAPAPAAAREEPPAVEPLVSGTILAPDDAPAGAAIYVSLRDPARPGPPIAAKRLPVGPFPQAFTVTTADRMMNLGPVPDAFTVKVTLDIDGEPMRKSPDDLEVVAPAAKGATDLSLTLAPRSP